MIASLQHHHHHHPANSNKHQEQTNINHCELLAALVAILTFPEMFRGRNVLLFTDNLTVLRCLVHGYMRTPELAHISNAIHLLLARQRAAACVHTFHLPVTWCRE